MKIFDFSSQLKCKIVTACLDADSFRLMAYERKNKIASFSSAQLTQPCPTHLEAQNNTNQKNDISMHMTIGVMEMQAECYGNGARSDRTNNMLEKAGQSKPLLQRLRL